MKYHFRVHEDEGGSGYWAECVELDGCVTEGDTLENLKTAAHEALNLYLEEPIGSKVLFPMPDENINGNDFLGIEVEPEISFALLLRKYRITNNKSQSEMATELGFNNLYSYQRLERKANPTLKLIHKIIKMFPGFPVSQVVG